MKIFLPLAVVTLCLSMLLFPQETFEAASLGLTTWLTIVLPSLLPFFIIAELFLGLGVVHFISILLEPIMRPIFNLPGCAAFVVALGYSSGFPVGASLTTSLRKQNLCTRIEGERLMSFTNNASPLFIFVAVAVGIFHKPALGIVLAAAHYLSNLTLGFLLRFYGRKDPEKPTRKFYYRHLFTRSIRAMFEAQQKDGRPLGKLLSDAVRKSMISLATIGGFIILFAVLIKMMGILGISRIIEQILALVFYPFHFPQSIITALSGGLFEMTLGAKMAGESIAPLSQQIIAVSMVMGWSGLCIQAQIIGIISDTDLHFLPFFMTRLAHMLLSGLFAYFLVQSQSISVINMILPAVPVHTLSYVVIPLCLCLLSLIFILCPVFIWLIIHKSFSLITKIRR